MSGRGGAATVFGMASAALGTISLSVGLARADLLPALFGLDGWMIATGGGFFLLVVGLMVAISSVRGEEEPEPLISATVAFSQRALQVIPMPDPRPMGAPGPIARAPARGPLGPRELAMFRLDEEIRDLTRRINKAGVLLATGQLSNQGYAQYVDDLKRQRGNLEATRVRLELNRPGVQ